MHVAFDFDGTLVDSMPALRKEAVNLISEAYDKSYELADTWYMSTIGRSFREQLDFLFRGDALNEEIAGVFYKKQMKIYENVVPHFGVVDTLNVINDLGWRTSIFSSTVPNLIWPVVQRLFPEFQGHVSFPKRKALESVKPDWFIGDTVYDYISSRKHVGNFVGVTHTSALDDVKRLGGLVTDSIPDALDTILGALPTSDVASQEPGGGA